MHRLAALALVVVGIGIAAGCGGGGGGTPAPGKVTVVHPGPLDASEKMALVLDDSAGRLVSSTAVTSSGADAVTVPPHGSVLLVTALNATNIGWAMVAEPAPGSTIAIPDLLAVPTATPTPASFQTWNATWNPVATATQYQVFGPCTNTVLSGTALSVTTSSCAERTTGKLLVVALDGSNSVKAWHETPQLPALLNTTTPVSFTLDQTTPRQVFSDFTNIPPSVQGLGMAVIADDADLGYGQVMFSAGSVPPGISTGAIGGETPDVSPIITLEEAGFGAGVLAMRVRHLPAVPGSLAFDLAGLELPSLPGFDSVSGTWFLDTPTFGDGVLFFSALRGTASFVAFSATLPPGTQSVALPQVPPDFVPGEPIAALSGLGAVLVEDVAGLNGYADFVNGAPFDVNPFDPTRSFEGVVLIGELN